MKWPKTATVIATLALACGCSSDDTYTTYSKYKANFAYSNVITATPLKNALNSPGEFCAISLGTSTLDFNSPTLSYSDPITASTMFYQKFICICGFIVGMANTPELNTDGLNVVCFDLACPNCHRDDAVDRNLTLKENGYAYCSRCKRTYNLNSQGIVNGSPAGRPLERYHVSYDGSNRLAIWN